MLRLLPLPGLRSRSKFLFVPCRQLLWRQIPLPKWGAAAQWLERATDNRVVADSNPTEADWKLWQFPLPHFASVFRTLRPIGNFGNFLYPTLPVSFGRD